VQFGAVDAEAGHGVEHETAEKARAIRLEEALQGPPDAVVVDEGDLVGLEPEERRIMTGRPIVHRVQRLMRERQVAHHHSDGLGRRQAHPAVCARQVFLEQLRHREAIQEVVTTGRAPSISACNRNGPGLLAVMPYTVYSVRYEEVDVPVSARDDRRADQARQRLVEFLNEGGHVLPGSLVERRTRCGKANCRCHAEPPELHGPYFSGVTRSRTSASPAGSPPSRRSATGHGSKQPRLRELVTELERLEILSAERAEGWGT